MRADFLSPVEMSPHDEGPLNIRRLAFADRLKPLFLRSQSRRRRPGRQESPSQSKAKEIVKKYRRRTRKAEFRRLRLLVPAVAENEKASEVIEN